MAAQRDRDRNTHDSHFDLISYFSISDLFAR